MKYEIDEVRSMLEKRGARFRQKEIDMTRPRAGVVGIDSLGKLNYFSQLGYLISLPEVQMKKNYRGLSKPWYNNILVKGDIKWLS